jgi:hypothetical protein
MQCRLIAFINGDIRRTQGTLAKKMFLLKMRKREPEAGSVAWVIVAAVGAVVWRFHADLSWGQVVEGGFISRGLSVKITEEPVLGASNWTKLEPLLRTLRTCIDVIVERSSHVGLDLMTRTIVGTTIASSFTEVRDLVRATALWMVGQKLAEIQADLVSSDPARLMAALPKLERCGRNMRLEELVEYMDSICTFKISTSEFVSQASTAYTIICRWLGMPMCRTGTRY